MATKEVRPGHWEVTCDVCGKPLIVANEHGMFCEDMHGYDESVKAKEDIRELLKRMGVS